MPVEALAERGPRTLTFGPLKPVGFVDPRTGRRPWAVLQLRAENANSETCNLVGCQTKLTQPEQARVFRLVPGLERAEFARYGSMHRNTYVNAPEALNADLSLKTCPHVFLAGRSPRGRLCGVRRQRTLAGARAGGPGARRGVAHPPAGERPGCAAAPSANPVQAFSTLQRALRPHAGTGRKSA